MDNYFCNFVYIDLILNSKYIRVSKRKEKEVLKQVSASVLYNNVKFAAKQKQMKIGDIEEKAGVSPGYFSRLAGKDDRNSTIDALMNVADLLGVSFELLLTSDLESKTPTERLVLDFIKRLASSTAEDNISWQTFKHDDLLPPEYSEINDYDPPQFSAIQRKDGTYEVTDYQFKSMFNPEAQLDGDSFIAHDANLGAIFLMKVRYGAEPGLELYLFNNGVTDAIAWGYQSDADGCYGPLSSLYTTALESSRHIQISSRAKDALRIFLSNEAPKKQSGWTGDDIPF